MQSSVISPSPRRKKISLLIAAVVLLAGVSCWAALRNAQQLRVTQLSYRLPDGTTAVSDYPLSLPHDTPQGVFDVEMVVETGWLHPRTLLVLADDCVEELRINSVKVEDKRIPYCDYNIGRPLHVGEHLRNGTNSVSVRVKNSGGELSLRLKPAPTDPLRWLVTIVLVLSLLAPVIIVAGAKKARRPAILTGAVLILIALVRLQYGLQTPYGVRGHDTDAHIDYIKYVAEHRWLPPANDGWEYHQPPLYYAVSALVYEASLSLQKDEARAMEHVKLLSVFLSIVSVMLLAMIAASLFPSTEDGKRRALFLWIAGTLPSAVFLASRIGNDALFVPLGLWLLLVLIHCWKRRSIGLWYAACVLLSLCFLTKVTAVVFGPVLLLCLLRVTLEKRRFFTHALVGGMLFVLLAGWLPVMRALDDASRERTLSLGNIGMHSGLQMETSASNLLTFDPAGILQKPFNNPWEDDARRQYFPEYLFRSAFFGEFNFGDSLVALGRMLLLSSLLALPLMAFGLTRMNRDDLPAVTLLAMLLCASIGYRIGFPYSANQDFRFIVLAIVPLTLLCIRGADSLPASARRIFYGLLSVTGILSIIFLSAIAV